ncbi:MAG TPA: hypothetical protein VFX02_03995 [Gammaproteobacteria bacterium]|nr:hypothetical protein [Gammaproteobacteria bacterium]
MEQFFVFHSNHQPVCWNTYPGDLFYREFNGLEKQKEKRMAIASKPPFPLGNPKGVITYIKSNTKKIFDEQQCKQISYQVEQAARLPSEVVNQK